MKQLLGVKTIIFDLGGVILNIDYQLTVAEFQQLGIHDFDEIFSQYKQSSLSDGFETGQLSEFEYYIGIKKLSGVEFSFQEFKHAWNAMLLDLPNKRISLLENLSRQYRLFLFSNTNETHYKEFKRKAGDHFDSIFEKVYYSHLFGKRKPDTEAFLTILKENQLQAKETLFVDDSIQHIEAAKTLGIQTRLIKDTSIIELRW